MASVLNVKLNVGYTKLLTRHRLLILPCYM